MRRLVRIRKIEWININNEPLLVYYFIFILIIFFIIYSYNIQNKEYIYGIILIVKYILYI